MSRFLYHESCPQCHSKDNLAVFDDGHKWCFGCHHYEPSTTSVKAVFSSAEETVRKTTNYPYDATDYLPASALKWLLSCNISFEKIKKYNIQWSPKQHLICWKIYNRKGKELAWQGRCFSPEAKTKYVIHGKVHEDICILEPEVLDESGEDFLSLVLVEDYLSAIQVSNTLPCMPLFGCICSLQTLGELRKHFNKLVVWLDSDKLDNARKVAQKAAMLGMGARVLYTPKDPKEYNEQEIRKYLEVFK